MSMRALINLFFLVFVLFVHAQGFQSELVDQTSNDYDPSTLIEIEETVVQNSTIVMIKNSGYLK